MGVSQHSFLLIFCLFQTNKRYYFYNKLIWKNVHPVPGTGIRTHESLPITTRPVLQQRSKTCKQKCFAVSITELLKVEAVIQDSHQGPIL